MTDVKELADRPALSVDEVEVTPEMIEAGRDEIAKRWVEFVSLDGASMWPEVLTAVYLAMSAKIPSTST